MVTLLTAFLCLKGVCIEVPVPTPLEYQCGSMAVETLTEYLFSTHRGWEYVGFRCQEGRYV